MGDDSFGFGFALPSQRPCIQAATVLGPGRARHFVDTETDWMRASLVPSTSIWSFSIWVKTTDVSQQLVGIYKAATTDGGHELILTASGNVRQIIEQDNGLGTAQDHGVGENLTAINDGEWHHVCGSLNDTTMSVWVDGIPGSYTPDEPAPTNANPMSHLRSLPNPTHISLGYRYLAPPWNGFEYLGDLDECSFWDGYYLTDADAVALNALGRDSTKRYFTGTKFGNATITAPTHHWSLSETLHPSAVGRDDAAAIDLTDNGTADVEGIPAGEAVIYRDTSQNGDWASSATWGGASVPTAGNAVTILHDVTVSTAATVGHSPTGSNRAMIIDAGSLTIQDGGTFTMRGHVASATDGLTVQGGGTWKWDDTSADSSTNYKYTAALGKLITATGTAPNHSTITSNSAGSPGYFSAIPKLTYCDVSYQGTASIDGIASLCSGDVATIANCTFDNCGEIYIFSILALQTPSIADSTWTNTVSANSLYVNPSGGTTTINGCVFDKPNFMFGIGGKVNLTDCVIVDGCSAANLQLLTWTGCFVVMTGTDMQIATTTSESYILISGTTSNPHINISSAIDYDLELSVFDSYDANSGGSNQGDLGIANLAGTYTVKNCLYLPSKTSKHSISMLSALGGPNSGAMTAEHNTYISRSQGLTIGETYAGHVGLVASCKSNIFYSDTVDDMSKVDGFGTAVEDIMLSSSATHNCGYNFEANSGGYKGLSFSSGTPGANDVDEDPNFVDATRTIESWDTSLGGDGTVAHAIAEMKKLNDSDYDSNYNVAALLAYLRAGYAPQNTNLTAAGHDSEDIGALAVV